MIFGAIKRFVFPVLALAALVVSGAVLLVWLAGVEVKAAFMAMLLAGGVLLTVGGVLASPHLGSSAYHWGHEEKEQRISESFVFIAVGLPLLALGFLLAAL